MTLQPTHTLRSFLREETAQAHDRLDRMMRQRIGWRGAREYADFLSFQFAARKPVEDWLANSAMADHAPPAQTPLIARDLASLGATLPPTSRKFALPNAPSGYADGYAQGVAWVLAGSALGNRAIANEVERAEPDNRLPREFLTDPEMLTFWSHFRRSIERIAPRAEMEVMAAGAAAVFDHFIRELEDWGKPTPSASMTQAGSVLVAAS